MPIICSLLLFCQKFFRFLIQKQLLVCLHIKVFTFLKILIVTHIFIKLGKLMVSDWVAASSVSWNLHAGKVSIGRGTINNKILSRHPCWCVKRILETWLS